ncbi:helix-turn-helix transcriptional regulator [Gordonia sp. QH-12]|uniref:helix-turn-helix domain-containing protein n=1 Tax=Gordonia sp. QH-12 TaxID=1437876 RepID=UPI000A4D1B5B|nr:helix-turn-helix transcriptional regulator [Gordonia sp. QH-12]
MSNQIRTGATIKALREKDGWALGKFASALGVSHSYMSNIEAGRKRCTPALARSIADLLGVPLAAITTGLEKAEIAEPRRPERTLSVAMTRGFERLASESGRDGLGDSGRLDRIDALIEFRDGDADLERHLSRSALRKLHLAEFVLDPKRVQAFEEFLTDLTHSSSPCSVCGASSVGEADRSAGGDARPSTVQADGREDAS